MKEKGAPKIPVAQPWQMEITGAIERPVNFSCVGVGENLLPEQVLGFAMDSGLSHLCQKAGHLFESELKSAKCIIETPENYRKFPIATILTPDDLSRSAEAARMALEHRFNSSNQKQDVLARVFKALQSLDLPQTMTDDISAVADEFFTNAIYNAPFVDLQTHRNPGVSRKSAEIKLAKGKFARLFLAHDESRLVIGCEDPFGSLDMRTYMGKIRAAYERGPAATMNFGAGGAGIGSYIIFNAGSSLYFGVWPGRATILCCVVPLGLSGRKRLQLAKHFHWIQG